MKHITFRTTRAVWRLNIRLSELEPDTWSDVIASLQIVEQAFGGSMPIHYN